MAKEVFQNFKNKSTNPEIGRTRIIISIILYYQKSNPIV